ncbi:hypothetical protein D9M68_929870 [compost metagenome]
MLSGTAPGCTSSASARSMEAQLRSPYHTRKAAPPQRASPISSGESWISAPMPATPAPISTTSIRMQVATVTATCWRRTPTRSTWAFWAPMAMMRLAPRPIPLRKTCGVNMASSLLSGDATIFHRLPG